MDQHATHPIEEGDLLAFLDGAAAPKAAAHIASCAECLAEARSLHAVSAMFGAALERDDCPAPDALLEYSMGWSERADQQRIGEHLAECERCTAELAELSAVNTWSARAMPELWGPIGVAPVPEISRIIAQPLVLPTRGYAVRGEEQRQLAFEAGAYRIVLSLLVPGVPEQGWRVDGQVSFGADGEPALEGAAVTLLIDGTPAASDTVDDLGYFALSPVPAGQYTLELSTGEQSIAIDELQLQ